MNKITFKNLKKDIILFIVCCLPGFISFIISITHRLIITSNSYTSSKWITVELFFVSIYILLIFVFLIVSIILRFKDKKYKYFLIDIIFFIFLCFVFILTICIDYPTLIYMT